MGEPVKIMDLAKQLIRFYGYEPGVNMDIKIVGLRPGEKLYEELMMDEEQDKMRRTVQNKIFVAPPRNIDLGEFYQQLRSWPSPPSTTTTAWWSSWPKWCLPLPPPARTSSCKTAGCTAPLLCKNI